MNFFLKLKSCKIKKERKNIQGKKDEATGIRQPNFQNFLFLFR